jgi:medium-chain acyl-[acyl-carrier-protein] hydrolase
MALTRAGRPPAVVAVAGRQAPHLAHRRGPLHRLGDDALFATLAEMGGTPAEVLNNRELMALILPALRADIRLAESFLRPAGPAFSCPLLALAGQDDPFALPSDVQAWRSVTTGRFRFECFEGGHFFTMRHRDAILAMIVDEAMAGAGL